MAKADLTAQRLRELLDYNQETGVFTWKVNPRSRAKLGDEAGWLERGEGKNRRSIEIEQHNYRAHRLAWLYVHGNWPVGVIDHLNGDASDNRLANLRDVSQRVNVENRRIPIRRSKSGLLGASWDKRRDQWVSFIMVNRKIKYLGRFQTAEDAHYAYVAAKRRLHEGCTI